MLWRIGFQSLSNPEDEAWKWFMVSDETAAESAYPQECCSLLPLFVPARITVIPSASILHSLLPFIVLSVLYHYGSMPEVQYRASLEARSFRRSIWSLEMRKLSSHILFRFIFASQFHCFFQFWCWSRGYDCRGYVLLVLFSKCLRSW